MIVTEHNGRGRPYVLKSHLTDELQIDPAEIAIATGSVRDLDGMDLLSDKSPINYVITVQALKEGWDCPFAYVFCSVANVSSAQDVEQLLGWVLRMPYAKRRSQPALNRAYANVTSENFANAANALRDGLVKLGFSNDEAAAQIEVQPELDPHGLFGPQRRPPPKMTIALPIPVSDEMRSAIAEIAPNIVSVTAPARDDEEIEIEIVGVPTKEQVEAIAALLPEQAAKGMREAATAFVYENEAKASPAARGAKFTVPAIVATFQGELQLVEPGLYPDEADINLSDLPPTLTPGEFMLRSVGQEFEIDVDGNRVTSSHIGTGKQGTLFGQDIEGLSPVQLAVMLARDLRDPMISHGQLQIWLTELIASLAERDEVTLPALVHCRHILMRSIREKIAGFMASRISGVYENTLFGPEPRCALSVDQGFTFKHGMFADVPKYDATHIFKKHFLGPYEVPVFDGKKTAKNSNAPKLWMACHRSSIGYAMCRAIEKLSDCLC